MNDTILINLLKSLVPAIYYKFEDDQEITKDDLIKLLNKIQSGYFGKTYLKGFEASEIKKIILES